MNIVCVILGLNIYGIFIVKPELLYRKQFFFPLFVFNFALYVIGHLLEHFGIGNPKYESLLKIPAPQQALFFILLIACRTLFRGSGEDAFKSMAPGKLKHRTFSFIFIVLSVIPTGLALINIV
ncbi:MAG: hypothetical protein JST32_10925 [Bacteroidetes bacterium]|nr:hypothetical protein [Bacteroidota bacterium]